ncbi:MAG TPA: hypothetical protein VMW91_04570 [Desulfosporosinus sp.]|nr:hypothetical protein [Desulfosporosinus sp.]
MEFYKCKHFKIEELVDPETFAKFGEGSWMLFTPQVLRSADAIRGYFNRACVINDWKWGGARKWSGFRPRLCSIGASFSQHRFGNGIDMLIDGIPAASARKEIIAHKDDIFTDIMCLEDDVGWLHFDCRNIPDRIRIVKP